ncbi:MAG: hypothetical protein HYZ81_15730 [Nitrospinae bacterium]|nr:hypothetical protein [Nitrospinota bacterium]
MALRWQDVDLDAWLLQVRRSLARVKTHGRSEDGQRTRLIFQEPKTEQSQRTIPIPEEILDELPRHKARQAQERLLIGEAYEDHVLVFYRNRGRSRQDVPLAALSVSKARRRLGCCHIVVNESLFGGIGLSIPL